MAAKGSEVEAAERRIQSVQLRAAGLSYRQIGAQLGVSHEQARQDVLAGLKAAHQELAEHAEELIALQWERLESTVAGLVAMLKDKGLKPAERQGAIDTLRKVSESQRKLRGLDQPEKRELSGPGGRPLQVELTDAELDAEISRLEKAVRGDVEGEGAEESPEPPAAMGSEAS